MDLRSGDCEDGGQCEQLVREALLTEIASDFPHGRRVNAIPPRVHSTWKLERKTGQESKRVQALRTKWGRSQEMLLDGSHGSHQGHL